MIPVFIFCLCLFSAIGKDIRVEVAAPFDRAYKLVERDCKLKGSLPMRWSCTINFWIDGDPPSYRSFHYYHSRSVPWNVKLVLDARTGHITTDFGVMTAIDRLLGKVFVFLFLLLFFWVGIREYIHNRDRFAVGDNEMHH